MNRSLRLTVLLAATAVAAGAATLPAVASRDASPSTLTVRVSDYGQIVFDARGRALYAFTRDPRGRSVCTGACAAAWPPYVIRGRLRPGESTSARLLGTTRRSDGSRQVTYAGRPLYYYVGDREPGEVRCQNVFGFDGLWLVVRPNGRLVR